jgi:hypothetical protein
MTQTAQLTITAIAIDGAASAPAARLTAPLAARSRFLA